MNAAVKKRGSPRQEDKEASQEGDLEECKEPWAGGNKAQVLA